MPSLNVCEVCKKPAPQSCSACSQAHYCSKDHQKLHWKTHKNSCAPFKIVTDNVLGRYLIATRNINENEIIMQKPPLILGPKTVSNPLCLGCHKKLFINNPTPESFHKCSKCAWPLCSKACEDSVWHQYECGIFTKTQFKPSISDGKQSIYSCIIPLRALSLKENDKNKYETLLKCQEHLQKHLATPLYQILKKQMVPMFSTIFKLPYDENEILKICSIFDTNSFEVRDSNGFVNIRGLYPTMSLLAHDCKHNTKHIFRDDDFQLTLIATVPIKKGERITTTYTQTLWNTLARRQHLKVSKLFDCCCERCQDPTEFGTFAGAILCNHCQSGAKIISSDPLNPNADWSCTECQFIIPAKQIIWGNDTLKKEISLLNKTSPKELEDFLVKYQDTLHPTNSHLLEVKYALTQMYGNLHGYELEELPINLIQRKIELCQELLDVASILEPGLSRFRGMLLYDLQAALVKKIQLDFVEGKITKDMAEDMLRKSISYLEEAVKILSCEPKMKEILMEKMANFQKMILD